MTTHNQLIFFHNFCRVQNDKLLEEERKTFRAALSEREGAIVKLQSEFDGIMKEINSLKVWNFVLIYLNLICFNLIKF